MSTANTLGSDVMMQLGTFQFSIASAAYQELNRSTEHTWASVQRFGQLDALQYTGPGSENISLPGVIYPEYAGGLLQVELMRALAGQAEPLLLMDGTGLILGLWVIERIEEKQARHGGFGVPMKQEFTIEIRKFGDVPAAILASVSELSAAAAAAVATVSADVTTPEGATSEVTLFSSSVVKAAELAVASIRGSISGVVELSSLLGTDSRSALGALRRSMDAASGLKDLAGSTMRRLRAIPTLGAARAGAADILNYGRGMLTQASTAKGVFAAISRANYSSLTAQGKSIFTDATKGLTNIEALARMSASKAKSLYDAIPPGPMG